MASIFSELFGDEWIAEGASVGVVTYQRRVSDGKIHNVLVNEWQGFPDNDGANIVQRVIVRDILDATEEWEDARRELGGYDPEAMRALERAATDARKKAMGKVPRETKR